MARPDHSTHRVADFIPQSVLHPRHYRLDVASYPARRFIEPAVPERRGLVLVPADDSPGERPACNVWLACLAEVVAFAVILYFLVPLLIGP
jgi:hypothetical protein